MELVKIFMQFYIPIESQFGLSPPQNVATLQVVLSLGLFHFSFICNSLEPRNSHRPQNHKPVHVLLYTTVCNDKANEDIMC